MAGSDQFRLSYSPHWTRELKYDRLDRKYDSTIENAKPQRRKCGRKPRKCDNTVLIAFLLCRVFAFSVAFSCCRNFAFAFFVALSHFRLILSCFRFVAFSFHRVFVLSCFRIFVYCVFYRVIVFSPSEPRNENTITRRKTQKKRKRDKTTENAIKRRKMQRRKHDKSNYHNVSLFVTYAFGFSCFFIVLLHFRFHAYKHVCKLSRFFIVLPYFPAILSQFRFRLKRQNTII